MNLSEVFWAIVGVLLPILFSFVIGRFPEFPLDFESFAALIMWVLGFLFSGYRLAIGRMKATGRWHE